MIAMSGGVDSSVAAALAADLRGSDACAGVAMRLYSTADDAARTGRTCCAPDDLYDARRAAAKVGIRFYVYDAEERFRAQVIEPFIDSYARGEIVDMEGNVLGAHDGVHRFTVGQRRGIGSGFKLPLYVAALDAGRQRVVVGSREEAQRRDFRALEASWVQDRPLPGTRCEVQIRHRGKPLPAVLDPSGGQVEVKLLEPALGVAPGQSAVFYQGDEVLGGATIAGS